MNTTTGPIPGKISLLLADVDGTLVTRDKVLTARTAAAVRALKEHGLRFAVTSSRPPRGLTMLVEPLAIDTPISGFNGGVFSRPDLSILEEHLLAPEVARSAVDIVVRHGLDAWVFTNEDWLVRNPEGPRVAHETRTVQFAPKIVRDFGPALDKAAKIVGVSDDHDRVAACETALQQQLGGRASATRSQPYYVDVTNPQANKGAVVTWLSECFSIPTSEIATIGDMSNDVPMFAAGGFSIAMGNASPEVQARADVVTESHEDEGFAKAVERWLLGAEVPQTERTVR